MESLSDDEFYEAPDEISSVSSSEESADESSAGRPQRFRRQSAKPPRHNNQPPPARPAWLTQSRFSVWQDGPKSIEERRRLLYQQFGLPGRNDGKGASGESPSDAFEAARVRMANRSAAKKAGRTWDTPVDMTSAGFASVNMKGSTADQNSTKLSDTASLRSSNGKGLHSGEKRGDLNNVDPVGLGRSRSDSAAPGIGVDSGKGENMPGIERLTQTSGAVPRELKKGSSSMKPPTGLKNNTGASKSTPSNLHQLAQYLEKVSSTGSIGGHDVHPTPITTAVESPTRTFPIPIRSSPSRASVEKHEVHPILLGPSVAGSPTRTFPNGGSIFSDVKSRSLPGAASPTLADAVAEADGSALDDIHHHPDTPTKKVPSHSMGELVDALQNIKNIAGSGRESNPSFHKTAHEIEFKIKDLDTGKEMTIEELGVQNGRIQNLSHPKLSDLKVGTELISEEVESSLSLSPVMQEVQRREREQDTLEEDGAQGQDSTSSSKKKKKSIWVRTMKGVAKTVGVSMAKSQQDPSKERMEGSRGEGGGEDREGSVDKDSFRKGSFERGKNGDSAAQLMRPKSPQRVKVQVYKKTHKDLSDLNMGQEIQAHQGAIWAMKFSLDGRYLASAGQDRIVQVREVLDHPFPKEPGAKDESNGGKVDIAESSVAATPEHHMESSQESSCHGGLWGSRSGSVGKKKSAKSGILSTKDALESSGLKIDRVESGTPEQLEASQEGSHGRLWNLKRKPSKNGSLSKIPKLFWLSETAICSFKGHTEDILDLSWSRTQLLLSSSMDQTVRLWHLTYGECLRVFAHNDYVTSIEFSPTDDRYFLSGSLDDKVRLWSIPDHEVVDWSDVREMVTAANYSSDGKRAVVGTYKGTCRFYDTTGQKLQLVGQFDVRNKKTKKSGGKKITGLQFVPGDTSKVLITSNDSRVRVYDGLELNLKFKGLQNINSHISATFSRAGEFIVSASEDSKVYVWKSGLQDLGSSRKDKRKSYEYFPSTHVSIALPWPGMDPSSGGSVAKEDQSEADTSSSRHVTSDRPMRSTVPFSPCSSNSSSRSGGSTRSGSCLTNESVGECKSEQSMLMRNGSVGELQDEEVTSRRSDSNGSIMGDYEKVGKLHNSFGEMLREDGNEPSASSTAFIASCDSPPLGLSSIRSPSPNFFEDVSAPPGSPTWRDEKLPHLQDSVKSQGASWRASSPSLDTHSTELSPEGSTADDAPIVASWGLVIVTASLSGEIRTYQNYGYPVRV